MIFVYLQIEPRYGRGTYFAKEIRYSSHYGGSDSNVIIISRVATGISKLFNSQDRLDVFTIPGSPGEPYHSVIANEGKVIIVSHDNAAYPEYILRIKHNTFRRN